MSTELVPYQERIGALSVSDVRAQVNLIQHIMAEVMRKDEHYGVIPGTGTKPTLLKAGAEKLCLTFRLDPQYEIEQKYHGVHLTIISKCTLWHIPSGQRFGSGMGSCSTWESKYAYRKAARKCPQCGAETIIKGKAEYGGGWVCFKKKGGCGAKYEDGAPEIEKQAEGRVPNEDIPDAYNTVLKMANKRSLVAAVLNATAASDIFTQDIEDIPEAHAATATSAAPPQPSSAPDAPPGTGDPQAAAGAASEPRINADQHIAIADALRGIRNGEARFLHQAGLIRLTQLPASEFKRALAWCEAASEAQAKEKKR